MTTKFAVTIGTENEITAAAKFTMNAGTASDVANTASDVMTGTTEGATVVTVSTIKVIHGLRSDKDGRKATASVKVTSTIEAAIAEAVAKVI